jgi:CubicO group peptidase (beta-lactamase class C family)
VDTGRIDEVFADLDPAGPGCVVGVVVDGELVHAKGYGLADVERSVPLSPDSVLDIGSTSKQFTAAAVLALSDDGLLGLDDPLCLHVPALPVDVFGQVTVRQLVHHTSGIPDHLSLLVLSGRTLDNDYQEDELVDLISRQRGLDFAPGTSFSYSNAGYFLLAEVVRAVTGRSLREVAQERLFAPAGMTSTLCHDDYTEIVRNRAIGYTPREGKGLTIDVPLVDTLGDGAVFTTVGDLCRWDAQFYDCTLPVEPDFMERLQQCGQLLDGTVLDYAFGLFVSSYRGLRRVQHGGSWGGYRAQLARFPEARTSIIVLANLAVVPVDEYVAAVADVVLVDRLAPDAADPEASEPVDVELGDRAGTYVNAGRTIAVCLELDDGAPVLDLTLAKLPLRPVAPDVLVASGIEMTLTLVPDGLTISSPVIGDFHLQRHDGPLPDAAELAALAGRYHSDELGVDVRLGVQDAGLQVRFGWSAWAPLTARGGRVFTTGEGAVLAVEPAVGAPTELTVGTLRSRLQRCARVD